jgi:hypothetical protein
MNREEQLKICRSCANHSLDIERGVVCNITRSAAKFSHECPDYLPDTSFGNESAANKLYLSHSEARLESAVEELERIRTEQNLLRGVLLASFTGLTTAVIWAVITVATNFQIGFMAIAVGYLVGYSMSIAGNGIDPVFGYVSAGIALVSCMAGNLFSAVAMLANHLNKSFFFVIQNLPLSAYPEMLVVTFSPIDLLFYGLATYAGYRYAFYSQANRSVSHQA